jgi:hypothetical protein
VTKIGGRDCGSCTACCEYLAIDGEDFKKPAALLCQHCSGNACRIYETRPRVCRDYYCGWQQIPVLDVEWRPDNSGVLLLPQEKAAGAPPGSPQGMEFMIIGGEAVVRRPGFAEFLALLISNGVSAFMSLPGRKALLNPSLKSAVAARDIAAVRLLLLRLYAGATSHSGSDVLPPI